MATSTLSASAVADAVPDYVAPRDGADLFARGEVENFVYGIARKLEGQCLESDGFPLPPNPTTLSLRFGNAEFPNLNVIANAHSLGLQPLTAREEQIEQLSAMPANERIAYSNAQVRCTAAASKRLAGLDGAVFQPLVDSWGLVVDSVLSSPRIRSLDAGAARCATRYGVDADTVPGLEETFLARIAAAGPGANAKGMLDELNAAGATIVLKCFTATVDATTRQLTMRRVSWEAQHALELQAVEQEVERAVPQIESASAGRSSQGVQ